ncbi:MAG TPA: hypothetical protein VG755_29125, partial [Nannocystaceae bacterium]|nr:hypothetical protein [Nannocystaceae bacterium]
LPAGCEEALAAANMTIADNAPVDSDATQGDLDALWNLQCRLPPVDQDYDGLGDQCDLCPFAFDPSNLPYTDATGKLWPHDGDACSGEHASADDCEAPGAGDDGGSESGESSSSGDGA